LEFERPTRSADFESHPSLWQLSGTMKNTPWFRKSKFHVEESEMALPQHINVSHAHAIVTAGIEESEKDVRRSASVRGRREMRKLRKTAQTLRSGIECF
jgi:hypothetical protein